MYDVLIVEDEQEIRNGLVHHGIWPGLGVKRVHAADDGLSALAVIRREPRIRLVVTDIRMKKMSGIDLIRSLYEELAYDGKVVIVSGYDDFAYAREAMRYGVVDFLLKPVDLAELRSVAARALAIVGEEERRKDAITLVEDAIPKLREELLQQLLGASAPAAPVRRLEPYELGWLAGGRLDLLVIDTDNLMAHGGQREAHKEKERILFAVGNILEHSLKEQEASAGRYVRFRHAVDDNWVVVFDADAAPSRQAFDGWLAGFRTSLAARMKTYVKVGTSIAAAAGGTLASLPALYEEAKRRITQTKLQGMPEDEQEALQRQQESRLHGAGVLQETRALAELLKHGEEQDVREALQHFPAMVQEWKVDRIRELHHRVFEWVLDVYGEARKAGWKREEWRRNPLLLWESIQAYDTLEALQVRVQELLLAVNGELRSEDQPPSLILQQAERYIRDRFAQPLTVQAVADSVYVTPEWLSTLFRKHLGRTFLDYVTHLRMERARTLLQDAGLKVYQISGEVGYKDTVYFSKLFKKKYGMTPKDFRNRTGIAADE